MAETVFRDTLYHVAHATRGRLRVRYPVSWLRRRRGVVEARLRGVRGVRSVLASSVTGSIVVDYDPFALAEVRLLGHLQQLHASLDRAPARVGAPAPRPADAG